MVSDSLFSKKLKRNVQFNRRPITKFNFYFITMLDLDI